MTRNTQRMRKYVVQHGRAKWQLAAMSVEFQEQIHQRVRDNREIYTDGTTYEIRMEESAEKWIEIKLKKI